MTILKQSIRSNKNTFTQNVLNAICSHATTISFKCPIHQYSGYGSKSGGRVGATFCPHRSVFTK